MKIEVELDDIAYRTFLMTIADNLPSMTGEERSLRARELGEEPLCKENVNDRIFRLGLHAFLKHIESPAESMAGTVIKTELLKTFTSVTRKMVDLYTLHESHLRAIGKEKGKDSPEYKAQGHVLTGICLVVAELDSELTGAGDKGKLVKLVRKPERRKK